MDGPEQRTFYPIFLDLADKDCLVVGGGETAERKVRTLLECGARVTVVSPDLSDGLRDLQSRGLLVTHRRIFRCEDVTDRFLVIGATDENEVNRAVFRAATAVGALCNIVDAPDLCDFIVPSVVRRGSLQIAISTGGKSPAYAKRVREKLEDTFGPEYGAFVDLLGRLRAEVQRRYQKDGRKRRKIWNDLINSDLPSLIRQGKWELVEARVSRCTNLEICVVRNEIENAEIAGHGKG